MLNISRRFFRYVAEHEHYYQSVADAKTTLEALGRLQVLNRASFQFRFGNDGYCCCLGQERLVRQHVKYLTTQNVIA